MKQKYALAVAFGTMVASAFGQSNGLPHTLSPQELPLIDTYRMSRADDGRGIQTPPPFEPRTMAEWEEIQSLVIAWEGYSPILKNIVRYAKEECEVIIVCTDPAAVTTYLNDNQNGGPLPDMSNISFIQENLNSVWMRDYGAETIYRNEVDTVMLLDWIYNRPRPLDDAFADDLATFKNIPIYSTTQAPYDLVHTGGNFMADGFGTAFSSNLVLDENGPNGQFNQTVKSPAEVDSLMHWFMGIEPGRYVRMTTLPYDQIHHIDMHMKLLDEETLLVGEFPAGMSDGPQIESNIQYILNNYNSVFGTPYRIVRVPMPPSTGNQFPPSASYRTYANNVFVNKTVLVPTYREEYDTTGLRILRESLPGYRVIGIDCDNSSANIISASGAIHCITKAVGVEDPLLISHQRLEDTYDTTNPYLVDAYIRHRSGIASAEVYWTTDTAAGFASVAMTAGGNDHWSAGIPAQVAGSTVFYYIHASANSGKQQVRPIVAPDGWWKFRVLDINTGISSAVAPEITEVYPNPALQLAVVTIETSSRERHVVTITDALGREVMRPLDGRIPSDGRVFMDVSRLSAGIYLVNVEGPGGQSSQRLMKR